MRVLLDACLVAKQRRQQGCQGLAVLPASGEVCCSLTACVPGLWRGPSLLHTQCHPKTHIQTHIHRYRERVGC